MGIFLNDSPHGPLAIQTCTRQTTEDQAVGNKKRSPKWGWAVRALQYNPLSRPATLPKCTAPS